MCRSLSMRWTWWSGLAAMAAELVWVTSCLRRCFRDAPLQWSHRASALTSACSACCIHGTGTLLNMRREALQGRGQRGGCIRLMGYCWHTRSVIRVGSLRLLIHWITVCVCVRVLLALPAVLLIKVNTDGGGTTLSCNRLIEHINQHQVSSSFNVFY